MGDSINNATIDDATTSCDLDCSDGSSDNNDNNEDGKCVFLSPFFDPAMGTATAAQEWIRPKMCECSNGRSSSAVIPTTSTNATSTSSSSLCDETNAPSLEVCFHHRGKPYSCRHGSACAAVVEDGYGSEPERGLSSGRGLSRPHSSSVYCKCDIGSTQTTTQSSASAFAGYECEFAATSYCTHDGSLSLTHFCTNQGICQDLVNPDQASHPGCHCPSHYVGTYCETHVRHPILVYGQEAVESTGKAGEILLALIISMTIVGACVCMICVPRVYFQKRAYRRQLVVAAASQELVHFDGTSTSTNGNNNNNNSNNHNNNDINMAETGTML